MLILCERCILGLKSRGETHFVGDVILDENAVCDFCDNPEELSAVILPEPIPLL